MAEHVKLRLMAAKAGVSMALLALIGGLGERAQAAPAHGKASHTSPNLFLKLGGITGVVKTAFVKLEEKWVKIDNAVVSLEKKVRTDFYDKAQANKTFLKIRDANSDFLKIKSTATNSDKLGGQTPDAFVQGNRARVVSGATTVATGQAAQPLLQLPGGIIVVSVAANADQAQLSVTNHTGGTLPVVQDADGVTGNGPASASMGDGSVTPLPAVKLVNGVGQIRLQLFPNSAFNEVTSVLVSIEPSPSGGGQVGVVGQLFTGGV